MEEDYIGKIKLYAGNYIPADWMICDGKLLPVDEYDSLFKLLGTTYGGDGVTNFALPDLRGRVPIGAGQGNGLSPCALGEIGGAETVTLTVDEIPYHTHPPQASSGGGNSDQANAHFWAGSSKSSQFASGNLADSVMSEQTIAANGGGQPHDNMLPFLPINICICVFGVPPN